MLHLTIHGRVHGVGFREFTRRAATAAGVGGWVRNRRDGTVEAVIDGPDEAVARLVDRLAAGPPAARVERIERRSAGPQEAAEVQRPFAIRPTAETAETADASVALPDDATVAAYRATDYFAIAPAADRQRRRFRIGEPARTHAGWLAERSATSATILTAWNPFGEATDAADNDRAQAKLQAAIAAAGLACWPASGEDPRGLWQPEPGFCVFDATDAQVDAWLRAFRQNAAVRITSDRPCSLVWHPGIRRRQAGGAARS